MVAITSPWSLDRAMTERPLSRAIRRPCTGTQARPKIGSSTAKRSPAVLEHPGPWHRRYELRHKDQDNRRLRTGPAAKTLFGASEHWRTRWRFSRTK